MSIVATKLFALNLVEVPAGATQLQLTGPDANSRLTSIEQDIEYIKQQISIGIKEIPGSPTTASVSSKSSDSILEDIPAIGSAATSVSDGDAEIKATPEILEAMKSAVAARKNKSQDPVDVMTSRIMSIIEGYGENESNEKNVSWLGAVKFGPIVRKHVEAKEMIPFVLPAFPWKSVNKVEKVLGALPDLGEELALGRLNNLVEDVKEIYEPGAQVLITSDGMVYNDLLGIPDEETYRYGAAFRRMSVELGYGDNIKFTRIMNLQGTTPNEDVQEVSL
jgi:hypothetical protein